jgi:catechol 2,3-dioxygenase-like lactoylglutathione lyase family enzyme
MTEFEGRTPILPVRNLAASIDHYVKVLGFKVDWQGPYFASVTRGKCGLFLAEGDQGTPGTWVWVGVSDADELLKEYRGTGAKIRHAPTNYQWAYEMQVEDLDGNVLRMGSEPKEGQARGDWLDMRGQVWKAAGESGWEKG